MSDHPELTEVELKQIIGSLELGSIVAANNREQMEVKPQSLQRVLLLARRGLEADAMRDTLEGLRIELCNRLDLDYTATTDADILSALEAARQEAVDSYKRGLQVAADLCDELAGKYKKQHQDWGDRYHPEAPDKAKAAAHCGLLIKTQIKGFEREAAAGTGEK